MTIDQTGPTRSSNLYHRREDQRGGDRNYQRDCRRQGVPTVATRFVGLTDVGFRTYIKRAGIARLRVGSTSAPNATRCMRIGDAFRESAVDDCCGNAANCWNVRTPTCTTRAACGGRICAGTTTSSSECSCMRARAISGCGCARRVESARHGGCRAASAALIAVLSTVWSRVSAGIVAVLGRHADHVLDLRSPTRRSTFAARG